MAEIRRLFLSFFRRLPSGISLALFGCFIIVVAWLFVLRLTSRDLEVEMRRINGENSALARSLEEHTARAIKTADNALLFLKREYEKHGTTTQSMIDFTDQARRDPVLNQIGLANNRGDLLLSAVPIRKPINIAHREHFQMQTASAAAGLFIAKPVVNLAAGACSIFLSRRLNGPDGSFAGVVTAGIDPGYFTNYFDAPELGPGRTIVLVGRDGIVRARRFQQQSEVGQDISSSSLFKIIRSAAVGNFDVVSPIDGLPKIASYRTVRDSSLIVVVSESKKAALAGFQERKKASSTGAAFFTLLTTVFCVSLIRSVRITDRQNARLEEELAGRERNEKKTRLFFEAFDQALDGVQIIDPRGNVMFSNRAMERIYGFSPEELHGKNVNEMNVDPEFAGAVIQPSLREQGRWSGEIEVWHKDGHRFPVWLSASFIYGNTGEPIAGIGIIRDITERKQAEEKLQQSLSLLKATLQSTTDGILVVAADGRIADFNEQFATLWGIPQSILDLHDDQKALDFVLEQLSRPQQFIAKVRELYATPEATSFDVLEFKDGRVFERYSQPQRIDGKPVGRVWSFRDVTEKLKMEDQIRHAQKLESVGILAGGIAHDFNNLLCGILGNVSLAKMLLPAGEQSWDLLQQAEQACEHATELSGRLLTFSKGGEPFKKTAVLGKTLRDSVLFVLSGSNVSAVFNLADDLAAVDADEGQMRQVFNNLAINAKEAMPGGGTLEVGAENQTVAPGAVPGLREGRYVKITFRDHGGGILQQIVGRIFDPYFSTKEMGERKGQGLGLTICHSIVKRHDGRITVATELGRGTVFTVYLPASRHKAAEQEIAAAREEGARQPGGNILVMDDDARVRAILGRMLKHYGYAADLFPDSAGTCRAYQAALASGVPYGLVILDLTIPGGKGGVETLRDLKDLDPQVRAIISSGYADDPILKNYKEHGFAGAIKKPYTAERLQEVLASIRQPPA